MIPFPPLNLSGGGAGMSSAGGGNGLTNGVDTPFNLDSSGWIVNLNSNGNTNTASGNAGANANALKPAVGNPASLFGGMSTSTLIIAAVVLLVVLEA